MPDITYPLSDFVALSTGITYPHVASIQEELRASGISRVCSAVTIVPGFTIFTFLDALKTTPDETALLNAVVAAHTGEVPTTTAMLVKIDTPHNAAGSPIFDQALMQIEEKYIRNGYYLDTKPGEVSILDILIANQIFLDSGQLRMNGANATQGDTMHFELVDKDDVMGLFGVMGLSVANDDVLVLGRNVENYQVPWYGTEDTKMDSRTVTQLLPGLYLRVIYNSVAAVTAHVYLRVLIDIYWYEA